MIKWPFVKRSKVDDAVRETMEEAERMKKLAYGHGVHDAIHRYAPHLVATMEKRWVG